MSVHAMIAAAYLTDLEPSTKLVLMAVADSSDEHTLEAAPGLPKLRAWAGLGKSQTLNLLSQLTTAGYLERVQSGRIGRRAVYRVFPAGIPTIPHPTEVAARYAVGLSTPVDIPVDNPIQEGPTARTLDGQEGPMNGQEGPMATGPLQSYPSVSRAPAPRSVVDNRASGFPGARPPADDAAGIARRARGANDHPCPVGDHGTRHNEIHGSCGRCAHAAAESNPATVADARRRARAALRTTTAASTATATEETRPA